MTQSRGFHGRLPGPLLETELPLMKNVTKQLAKSVLIPLGLIAAASAADEAIQNEAKEQKGWFLSLLLGTLGTGLFGNILAGKEWTEQEKDLLELVMYLQSKARIFNTASPLTNFEIQNYYQNKPRFNGAYSRDNLPFK